MLAWPIRFRISRLQFTGAGSISQVEFSRIWETAWLAGFPRFLFFFVVNRNRLQIFRLENLPAIQAA